MAPTETLAEQHFLTLEPLCAQLGVRCVLLTGSVGSKKIRDEIANGVAQIAVGTHALIQRDVEFADLAVAVVDEQHRFGVEQRQALAEGRSPARAAHDGDADPAHARADDLRRPRGERDREAAGEPQADRDRVGRRRALERGVRAAARAPRRRPAGVRRLPADRAVGDAARARGRGRGRAPAARRAARATASGCCTGS